MCVMKGRNGMTMNDDIEWLLKAAEREDGCVVSVGGLVAAIEERERIMAASTPPPAAPTGGAA